MADVRVPGVSVFAQHSPYSSLGRFADLVTPLPAPVADVCATARNIIAHYRGEFVELPVERREDVNSRWLEAILAVDRDRNGTPLTSPRPTDSKVAGCCRDHSLFVVGVLRQRGIPARNRVGFAGYFTAGFHHDHVIVEYWNGSRWIRTDPELDRASTFDARDMPRGPQAPFITAAEAWVRIREGDLAADRCGVFPGSELSGRAFVARYVVFETAHRYGDELLLWDGWGDADDPELIDDVAGLLIRADRGDAAAEHDLRQRYQSDPRLRPGAQVTQYSPFGDPPKTVNLQLGGRRD
jgi:hypothetical protein